MALTLKSWADKIRTEVLRKMTAEALYDAVAKQVVKDMNRIAMARIAEASMDQSLTFTYRVMAMEKTIVLVPSDPVLFKKLEFGEFNPDGTLKSPPHSLTAEWKAQVRV